MYADVARIKVRKASNCSLGDRLCSFAKIPMFVGPIQQTIITPRRVLGGGRAVSAVRLGTAMDQNFLHDFVNKSELTKELSSVRTSGVGHGAGTHGDGAASGRGEEGSQDASGQLGGDASSLGRVGPAASSNDASSTGVNTSSGLAHVDATDECVDDGSPAYAAALERDRLAQTNALAPDNTGGDVNPGGTPTGREGGGAHRRSRSVGGRGSQTDLTLDASPGSSTFAMNDDDDSLSTSAPGTGGSLGHTNSLGLSRRNNNSSFVLAPEDNPTPQLVPPPTFGDQGNIGEKHVLVMVGLPARGEFISIYLFTPTVCSHVLLFPGKTHMAKRLCQYLRFFHGARTQVFNVGSYRRKMMGKARADSEFFRGNGENDALRRSFARAALKDLVDFLFQEDLGSNLEQRASDSGRVAIFDATNTTKERREWIRTSLDGLPLKLLFIESVCTDPDVIDRNIWQVKVNNEDYSTDSDKKKAYEDFKKRIQNYEAVYQPIDEEHLSFIKLINCGKKVEINNIHG